MEQGQFEGESVMGCYYALEIEVAIDIMQADETVGCHLGFQVVQFLIDMCSSVVIINECKFKRGAFVVFDPLERIGLMELNLWMIQDFVGDHSSGCKAVYRVENCTWIHVGQKH